VSRHPKQTIAGFLFVCFGRRCHFGAILWLCVGVRVLPLWPAQGATCSLGLALHPHAVQRGPALRARTSLGGTSTAEHGRLLHCLENSLVSLAFVGSDGEVWLSESHGPQVGLSHRISALGGIAQAV